ncbi:tyrosine-protein kinase SRK2-like isoform X1 [Mercenaria mercenaria]|uniref:tyrosine-protein kinase SRK2-like isoform X1 n=2 Tax=Mercenaria mercenaria TaxID=6596 RepID=UPI00234F313D|nr:tyrosine-protein kinase SRK2-like isoform X1 [Mercenaria mercenaria]
MEKKGESKEKRKVSVGRSLTMRFSNYRNRGKSVDKCGRLTGNVTNFGKPLTTSVSMGDMDRMQSICDHQTACNCDVNRSNLASSKLKGKSAEKLTCSQCESERLKCSGVVRLDSMNVRCVQMFGSPGCTRSPAPQGPPPCPPLPGKSEGALAKSWDKIYASRKEWLNMAKSHNGRSSLKEKLQEEFLSCKICLEPYQRPKALPCLHSFCKHCLQDYVRRHTGHRPGYFPCPMCRKDIRIPEGGIEQFQDNFFLLSLSDTLEEDDDVTVWQDPYQQHLSPPRSIAPPTPLEQKLKEYDWYFGKVSRNASEEWLLSIGYPKGSFLVRQGEASPDTLTLSVRDLDELQGYIVKHYKIYTQRMGSPLTEYYFITPKRKFRCLNELVKHYSEAADGLCCKLTQVCGKPRSLSWASERGKDDDYTSLKETVQLTKRIGSGQFADVWLGKWHQRDVAVKIQRPDTVKMAAFLDEAQILKTLDHPNILKLLAVCNEKEPVYLVTEYLTNGRLSLYLREGKGSELKLTALTWICAQLADALAYMEKEKFIHRNLGARNIIVGEQNKVKIAGFGMTKCADDPDFNFRRGLKMAIKWMAPEVLLYNKYSTKADVWSFGILMMEVFMHGKEPYEGMGSKEAFENVQQGYRMPKPDSCPSEIYDVILSCWSTNPPSRPSFDFLNTFLHDWQSPS